MNIFQILMQNFSSNRTRRPEDNVPYPVDFRGELTHLASECTLCGTCVYVCSPEAIIVERKEVDGFWKYDSGRCTFCGRCVNYCPTHALGFSSGAARTVRQRSDEFIEDRVEYKQCKQCGALIIPIPHETLVRLYHSEEAAEYALKVYDLCERCRNRAYSQKIKSSVSGNGD